jgi:hypothetical protein
MPVRTQACLPSRAGEAREACSLPALDRFLTGCFSSTCTSALRFILLYSRECWESVQDDLIAELGQIANRRKAGGKELTLCRIWDRRYHRTIFAGIFAAPGRILIFDRSFREPHLRLPRTWPIELGKTNPALISLISWHA